MEFPESDGMFDDDVSLPNSEEGVFDDVDEETNQDDVPDHEKELLGALTDLHKKNADQEEEAPEPKDEEDAGRPSDEATEPTEPEANATDDDDSDVPDGPKELRNRYKEQRKQLREREQQLAEQTKQLDEYRKIQENAKAQESVSRPDEFDQMAKKYEAKQLIGLLGRIDAGLEEGTDSELAVSRERAFKVLMRKPMSEILEARKQARSGAFGEYSRHAEDSAQEALVEAMAIAEERKVQDTKKSEWDNQRSAAWEEVLKVEGVEKNQDGQINLETGTGKLWAEAATELSHLIPGIQDNPTAPVLALNYALLKRDAEQAKRIPTLEAEIETLKARLGKTTGPVPAGNGGADPDSASSGSDSNLSALRDAFAMR